MSPTDPPPPKATAGQAPPSPKGFGETDRHAPGGALEDAAHELDEDVDVKALAAFTIGMFVVIATVYVLMWGLLTVFQQQAAKNDPPQSPLAPAAVQMPPTTMGSPFFGTGQGPQLMTSEPTVLRKHRQNEAEALGSYGWVDEKAGIARIPIEEAKKLILQRGLPARAEPADPTIGTRRGAYGESSGGRLVNPKGTNEAAKPAGPKQEGTQ